MKTIKPSNLIGEINPPPSKSITHRALILAAMSNIGSKIINPLKSEDTLATKNGLERMGAQFREISDGYITESLVDKGSSIINCQNSGTTLRLLTGIASLYPDNTTLMGDESLNTRPMQPLIDALAQLGAEITSFEGKPPIEIHSPIKNYQTSCTIQGDISSQFISSLIFTSVFRSADIETVIELQPPIVSKPYLKLTEEMFAYLGHPIEFNDNKYKIRGTNMLDVFEFRVPADFSSVAFFVVAGALPGNKIKINNISFEFTQADAKILEFVELAGARVTRGTNHIIVEYENLNAFEANIEDCPDLFPILCVLASACDGTSKLYGAEHLKYKETDRIEAMTSNLEIAGIEVERLSDGAIITGGIPKSEVTLDSYNDHRIAMACAILATLGNDQLSLTNPYCVSVSYPNFFEDLANITIPK